MKKVIVLFGFNRVIKSAKKSGYYVINILESNKLFGPYLKASSVADRTIILNDLSELENIIAGITNSEEIDSIVSFTDTDNGVMLASEYSGKYLKNNNTYPPDVVEMFFRKDLTRKYLDSIQLNNVPYMVTDSINEAKDFLFEHSKIVVKPVRGQASKEVYIVKNNNELIECFGKFDSEVLIEKYIEGPEFSVESIIIDGEISHFGVTQKYLIGKNEYGHSELVETGHMFPANISREYELEIYEYINKLFSKVDIKNALCHSEIKISNGNIFLIETHIRAGGDAIPELVEIASGVDMYKTFFNSLQSNKGYNTCLNKRAAIKYLILPPGEIKSVIGLEEAQNRVYKNRLEVEKGRKIKSIVESKDRNAGYIIVENSDDAMENANNILSSLKIKIK